ncbi:Mce protein [Mycolicibacterium hippocampi]|uniref:Mce protein n=1 Tax=Mycolicibacterium hippocampi TaxID=659824 RepID=UPI003518EBE3
MADDAAAPEGELTKASRESGAVDPESEAVEPAASEEETTGTDDVVEADDVVDADDADDVVEDDGEVAPARRSMSHVKVALIAGIAGVVALAGLTGWLGYRAYESSQAEAQRNLFLQVGRQGALNLTTINHESAEADVQRILDSATGTFYDDFQQRAQPFVEVVKQAQSKSEGTIAEAGLESSSESEAQVLVAVTVQTTNAGAPEQEPRAWRMRLLVERVGDEAKVSNVEFVP